MKQAFLGTGIGVLAGVAIATSAGAYQIEAGGIYADFDDANDSAIGVAASYFFAPVDDSGIPRAEADFLRRASNLSAGYSTFDEADVDILGIGLEAYMENIYAAADLTQTDFGAVDSSDVSLELGFLPSDGVRLSVGYTDQDLSDTSLISLNGKMVRPLNGSQAFNLEASVSKADDNNDTIGYELGGDFYVNHDLSFGLSYADTDQSNSNETVSLRARMFFIPTLSARIEYNMQDFNDSILLGVTGRF